MRRRQREASARSEGRRDGDDIGQGGLAASTEDERCTFNARDDIHTAKTSEAHAGRSVPMTFFEDGICRAYDADPTKAMNIACLMVLDCAIVREALRAVLLSRALSFLRMRSRVVVDARGRHAFEELDPEAIVDRLLHDEDLTRGTWDEVQALVGRELLQPWRPELPHWEVFLVRGLQRSTELPGESALFFRLDHALGDGFALKNWLMSLTESIDTEVLSPRWTSRTLAHLPATESTEHLPQLLAQHTATAPPTATNITTATTQAASDSLLSQVAAYGAAAWVLLRALFWQVLLLLPALWIAVVASELSDTQTHLTFDEHKGHLKSLRKEVRVSREYSLASIRALAKSLSTPSKRVTVNDVLMGLIAGGLRGYLETMRDPVVGTVAGDAPCRCRLRAIMVTSLREKIRSNAVEFANCLTFLPISLPVDAPHLEARVYQIKKYIDFLKRSPTPWLILRLQQLLSFLLGPAAL